MKRKYYILIILAVLVGAAFILYYKRWFSAPAQMWKTCTIERGAIGIKVTATGSLSPLTTVNVGTQVSGMISRLMADFNSQVKKGQVIAVLDTALLAASYAEADALVKRTHLQLKEQEILFGREEALYAGKAISRQEYDQALTNLLVAQSALASARAQLRRAEVNRQYAVIRAPIDGIVVSRNVDVGQTVVSALNSPVLFVLAQDLRQMQLYANVDEADIGMVKPGQEVSFTVDAYPGESFSGRVNQIRLQPLLVQNVITYVVVIDVDNPELKLLPGLTANITFIIREHNNVLKVQSSALQFTPPEEYLQNGAYEQALLARIGNLQGRSRMSGDSAFIWLKEQGTLRPELVTLGIVESGFAEISGKVSEGDEVVIKAMESQGKSASSPFMPRMRH